MKDFKVGDWCWNVTTKSLGVIISSGTDSFGKVQFNFECKMNGNKSRGYYTLNELAPFVGEIPNFIKEAN